MGQVVDHPTLAAAKKKDKQTDVIILFGMVSTLVVCALRYFGIV